MMAVKDRDLMQARPLTHLSRRIPLVQFDSTRDRPLASWLTRYAASMARRASEYLARGADDVSSL